MCIYIYWKSLQRSALQTNFKKFCLILNYLCEWNLILAVLVRALEGPRYHEVISVVLLEKIRKKRVQPKGFCSAFTKVIKSLLRITLLPQVQEATSGSASPLPQTLVSRERKALKPALPPQKPRLGSPVEGMTKQLFALDTYKDSLREMHEHCCQSWQNQAVNSAVRLTAPVRLPWYSWVTLLVTLTVLSVRTGGQEQKCFSKHCITPCFALHPQLWAV